MRSREVVAALAMLVAVAAYGREPDVRGFKSYAMPAYTIITHDESAVRQVPSAIARIDTLLVKMLEPEGRSAGVPTYLVVAPENLWNDFLEPGTGIGGEYVPGRFVNYILLRNHRGDPDQFLTYVFHEYTHLFLRTHFRGTFPLWFDEGMAILMQFAQFRGASAVIGAPPEMSGGRMPLERLFRLDKASHEYRSTVYTGAVHYQSWALVHRGMVGDAEFGKQMFSFLDAVKGLQPIEEAVKSSFGTTIRKLSRNTYHYANRASFEIKWMELEPPPPVALEPGRSMSELEALELLAEIMFVSGFKQERLSEVIGIAFRRAPESPGVHVLRMRLAARDRADAALERLLKEIEPRLSDPDVARGVGLALFERVREQKADDALLLPDRERLSARASELLDRALRARPGDAESIWAYGILAARGKRDLSTALQRVKEISVQVPFNADLAMAAALLYEARGESAEMLSSLADAERFAGSAEQLSWARKRFDEAQQAVTR